MKYVETRTRFLRYFCKGIAARPYLYYCDIFQLFLKASGDFDVVKKLLFLDRLRCPSKINRLCIRGVLE